MFVDEEPSNPDEEPSNPDGSGNANHMVRKFLESMMSSWCCVIPQEPSVLITILVVAVVKLFAL